MVSEVSGDRPPISLFGRLHYLGSSNYDECTSSLTVIRQACAELGIPLADHKTESPVTRITFMDIMIDTMAGQLSLPLEKLAHLQSLLIDWGDQKSCSKKDLESLIGMLNHACKVVHPGRSFLRRMIDLLKQHNTIRSGSIESSALIYSGGRTL